MQRRVEMPFPVGACVLHHTNKDHSDRALGIFLFDSQRCNQHWQPFLHHIKLWGFYRLHFKTLIHQDINQSAFVNTGAVCSHIITPLMVIGIERNQSMLIASMEIKTHGRCSAERIRYGAK